MTYNNLNHSEDKIQADCFQHFWNAFPALRMLLYAVPNGGYRSAREGNKLKATGVVAGIPDLCLALGCRDQDGVWYNALYIEMKTETGRLSPDQQKAHAQLTKYGNKVVICRSKSHFKELIGDWVARSENVAKNAPNGL